MDDTFLKSSALTHQIKSTDKFDEADKLYESMLSDIDDVNVIAEDNTSEGYNMSSIDLKFDKTALKSFLNKTGISENVLLKGIFAIHYPNLQMKTEFYLQ